MSVKRCGASSARSKRPRPSVSTDRSGAFCRGVSMRTPVGRVGHVSGRLREPALSVTLWDMKYPSYMIESPGKPKHDRLAAFFEAFDLSVAMVSPDAPDATANLVVTG